MGNLVVCVACKKKTCTYYTVILAPSNHANKISYNCIFYIQRTFIFYVLFTCLLFTYICFVRASLVKQHIPIIQTK